MKKLRIGLAGLGTVGKGFYDIIHKDSKILQERSNVIFEITAVANRSKKDFVDSNIKFYSNVVDLAKDENVDVVIEAMGGKDVALDLILTAFENGKKVVTANKALIAEFSDKLIESIEKNNGSIGFEASTAGANPVIKNFRESFSASKITEFYGILNGTCNFILTKMLNEGSNYHETLKEAQELGYAEANPTLDVKGIDTAHKLAILSAIASSSKPQFDKLYIEGVDTVTLEDITLANNLDYKIKLLGVFKQKDGEIFQAVYPSLVKKSEKIAQVDGAFNAVLSNTSNASWNLAVGRGAGGLTTGSAMVADLIDIALNRKTELFGVKNDKLKTPKLLDISQRFGKYFINLSLDKEIAKNGDIAKELFGDKIEVIQASFIDNDKNIIAGFLTNEQNEKDIIDILKNFNSNLVKSSKFIRVEETNF